MKKTARYLCFAALLVLGTLGCSNSLPPKADPDLARAALKDALDAWQKGESHEDLAKRSPPIYFTDLQQRAGKKLEAFRIEEGHTNYGQSVRLTALLRLKDPGTERKAAYLIDTSPAVVIVPDGQ